ncbi:hypothetical protein [Dactylosporangium sp. NPDC000521]|uniref:hypothetical protein n=1 Tax=Dactylosporangium sp. NPDC000521 TaxID=3363975 RepID=UPI003676164A
MTHTVPTGPPRREPDLSGFDDYLAAARKLRAVNRDALGAVLDGIQLDAGERHIVNLLAEMPADTVAAALQLLERCRAGAGAYTTRLTLAAGEIERAYTNDLAARWQILDAKDEATWHDITGLVECDDNACSAANEPGGTCVAVLSTAWAGGVVHLHSAETVHVRIPASAW